MKKTIKDILQKLAHKASESYTWKDSDTAVEKAIKEIRRIMPKKQYIEFSDDEGYHMCDQKFVDGCNFMRDEVLSKFK